MAWLKFINLCLTSNILERTKRANKFSWNLIYFGEKKLYPSNWVTAFCFVHVFKVNYYERYRNQCNMRLIDLICLPEGEKSYSAKQQHEFSVRFNKYLNSDEYRKSAISSLDMYAIKDSGPQFQFLTTLLHVFHLERKFFEDLSGCLNLKDPESIKSTSVPAEDLPALARGKIRYISGYVLAKLKHNFQWNQ